MRRFLRAENAQPEDRGNALLVVEFVRTVNHASLAVASQYALERHETVPRSGLVKFERMTGEVVNYKRYFQTGLVNLVGIVPRGVRTDETWQITGGALLTEEELV